MYLKLNRDEIQYLIKQMMTYNKNLSQSECIAEYILTHHRLNNLDYLYQIITEGYKTISPNDIYNNEYLNKVVITQKIGEDFIPTVCLLQFTFNSPEIREDGYIVSEVSIETMAKCLTTLESNLMLIALKMEGFNNDNNTYEWGNFLKRMRNYLIANKRQYLEFNLHEHFSIVEVSESGNALLVNKNILNPEFKENLYKEIENMGIETLNEDIANKCCSKEYIELLKENIAEKCCSEFRKTPKWKEQEDLFEKQQKEFYGKDSKDKESSTKPHNTEHLKNFIKQVGGIVDDKKADKVSKAGGGDTTIIETDDFFYKKFDTDEEMNEYVKTHFPDAEILP